MEDYSNDVFSFGNEPAEEVSNNESFNYDSISGLGESNYENEDLFSSEVETNSELNKSDFRIKDNVDNLNNNFDLNNNYSENYSENVLPNVNINENSKGENNVTNEDYIIKPFEYVKLNNNLDNSSNKIEFNTLETNNIGQVIDNKQSFSNPAELYSSDEDINLESPRADKIPEIENDDNSSLESLEINNVDSFENPNEGKLSAVAENTESHDGIEKNDESNINISDTPIEDLNKLTEYKDDKIVSTDISSLFDKVSVNVKDASEIFKRNTDLKSKIDSRFDELKKLQSEIENSKRSQKDEIDKYKEEVYNKLTEKKEEIEKRLNLLKEVQTNLEKEKNEFEQYRRKEKENIEKIQKEVQAAYDDRREELNGIEDVLRKQKDALDEERNQLSLDRIQYEADKNELANNLLKFNDLVNSFTNGVGDIKE